MKPGYNFKIFKRLIDFHFSFIPCIGITKWPIVKVYVIHLLFLKIIIFEKAKNISDQWDEHQYIDESKRNTYY